MELKLTTLRSRVACSSNNSLSGGPGLPWVLGNVGLSTELVVMGRMEAWGWVGGAYSRLCPNSN